MTEASVGRKRVTFKRPHPNPLFHNWLERLYQIAVKNKHSSVPELEEAIASLYKYPLPLTSGAECAILKGFDKRLCHFLDAYLSDYKCMHKRIKVANNEESSSDQPESENMQPNGQYIPSTLQGPCSNAKSNDSTGENVTSAHKRNHKTFKNLVINTDKCPFSAMLGGPSLIFGADEDVPSTSTANVDVEAKAIETIGTISFNYHCQIIEQNRGDNAKKNSSEDTSNASTTPTNNNLDPIECLDDDDDDEDFMPCGKCDTSINVADAFDSYFRDKLKRDAAEIEKCVLPRKMYKPAYRSGAYAILIALMEQRNECPYRDGLTKEELIQKAQKHTDQSFTEYKPDSNYTAWTNSKRLINKGLIQISSCDKSVVDFYTLTAMGRAVAMELLKESSSEVTINDIIFHGQPNDRVPSLEDVVITPPPLPTQVDEVQSAHPVFIEMPPGTFEIILLIDKRESCNTKINDPSSDLFKRYKNLKYEYRSITVGDFLWVARSKKTGQELVLPYIVERKRMDDLASSIKDGRFHEQKFRLRKCGLKNVVYLIESHGKNKHVGLPMPTLMQAVANTSIQEDFKIVKTESLANTVRFLSMLTQRLVHLLLVKFVRGCNRDTQGRELMTFDFFNKSASKNKPLTVKDTFIKMLLQLKGLSVEKALAITNKYPTPWVLIKAYEKCTEKEGEFLLANLKFNNFTRNVGPAVSKTIYQLFSKIEV